jgi:hypothetical protein
MSDYINAQCRMSEIADKMLNHDAHLQGGAVNRGLKQFFSMYRPSCLVEAYVRPEKYWFCVGWTLGQPSIQFLLHIS